MHGLSFRIIRYYSLNSILTSMDKKANDTLDEANRFLELVNKHLKEKNCKHTIIEVVNEFVSSN
jgi:hypothetical protein